MFWMGSSSARARNLQPTTGSLAFFVWAGFQSMAGKKTKPGPFIIHDDMMVEVDGKGEWFVRGLNLLGLGKKEKG